MRANADTDQMLAQQLNSIGSENEVIGTSAFDTDKNWKQWVWEESARRSAIEPLNSRDT